MSGPPPSPPSSSSGPSSPSASQSHSHSQPHSHSPAAETLHAPTHAAHAHYATHPIFAPHSRVAPAAPPAIPEKCLSWCSQRDGAPAMCRMLCLRRRPALPTQSEALAKLRPPTTAGSSDGAGAESGAGSQGIGSITGFFDAWRARCAPYSFIYVKGTPEGVVGRYMEEMDADDGQYDFGPVSRHAPHKIRRKSEGNVEYFDWGEAGYLLHVPVTSMLGPILNLPHNIERVFAPTTKLATRYYESFENGTQARSLSRFTEEVYKFGALDMASRVVQHWSKRWEQAEADAAAAREAASTRQAPDSVKEKNTKE